MHEMLHRLRNRSHDLAAVVGIAAFAMSCSGSSGDDRNQLDGATGGTTSSTSTSPSSSDATNCEQGNSTCFSFFVTSRARLFALAEAFNGSTKGWGGDLRYGTESGLAGADKICSEIAEQSLPGNGRTWRAFLSTSTVNAIDRVGSGPWYDRLNRLIANNVSELVATRPGGITNSTILNNLPNEDGTPHHFEEANCTSLDSCADNHDIMTGSDSDGKVCTTSSCAEGAGTGSAGRGSISDFTCQDWTLGTSKSGVAPRVGHSWPTGGGTGTGKGATGTDDWISKLTEAGCAAGYNLVQTGAATVGGGQGSVGEGGGYGAFYCLASN